MTSSMTSVLPLIARSSDGSLIAIHHPGSGTGSVGASQSSIRCYDGSVSNGSLKFTLRVPHDDDDDDRALRQLLFVDRDRNDGDVDAPGPPKFLCGRTSRSVIVWDLDRGVVARSIPTAADGTACDAAAAAGKSRLFVLVRFSSPRPTCRIVQYDLSAERPDSTPAKKIKTSGGATALSVVPPSSSDGRARLAIRTADAVRVLDAESGERLAKWVVPSSGGEDVARPWLRCSRDGRVLATTTGGGGHGRGIAVVAVGPSSLRLVGVLAFRDAFADVTDVDLDVDVEGEGEGEGEGRLSVVAFQQGANVASYFVVPFDEAARAAAASSSSSLSDEAAVPQTPTVELQPDNDADVALLGASFHRTKQPQERQQPQQQPRQRSLNLHLLFQRKRASSAATLPMEILPCHSLGEGTVRVGASLGADHGGGDEKGKKRKAADVANVALAPADRGGDAALAEDWTVGNVSEKHEKKQKKDKKEKKEKNKEEREDDDNDDNDNDNNDEFDLVEHDDDDEEDDEDGERGQSIAERLALLSSAMEQSDDDDDDDDDAQNTSRDPSTTDNNRPDIHAPSSATTETLTTLLTQALSSNDMAQLNIVLQVTNRRIVENTIRELQILDAERWRDDHHNHNQRESGYVLLLMGHLVRRMARRHSVVESLGVWVRAILAAVARGTTSYYCLPHGSKRVGNGQDGLETRIAMEAKEMASKLGPLKNFLNERVECFPQLLRLEGRLALLSQQL